jgi:hypothetical protein
MLRALAVLCTCLAAAPASAQTYVAGAAGTDTILLTSYDSDAFPDGGGTVPSFAARVGVPLGGQWGVELEVAQSLTLDGSSQDRPIPFVSSGFSWVSAVVTPAGASTGILIPDFSFESERRSIAVNPVAWIRLPVGSRLSLAFLGGVSFQRTTLEQRSRVQFTVQGRLDLPRLGPAGSVSPQLFPPVVQEQSTHIVTYDVAPLVGAEAWLAFGEHVHIVPGVRLSSVSEGWSVRPSAALAWTF